MDDLRKSPLTFSQTVKYNAANETEKAETDKSVGNQCLNQIEMRFMDSSHMVLESPSGAGKLKVSLVNFVCFTGFDC